MNSYVDKSLGYIGFEEWNLSVILFWLFFRLSEELLEAERRGNKTTSPLIFWSESKPDHLKLQMSVKTDDLQWVDLRTE